MKNIKTIFFDIDNTLLNHSGARDKAVKNFQKKYYPDVPIEKFNPILSLFAEKHWKLYEQKKLTFKEQGTLRIIDVWKTLGKSISNKKAYEVFNDYLSLYQRHWQPFPHVINTLKKLYLHGLSLGIISNGNKKVQTNKLKHLKIYSYLNEKLIIISEEIGYAKPHSQIFFHAQNLAGVRPEEIVMIGDNYLYDIEPGKKIGWNVLFFDYFNLYPDKQSIKNFKDILSLFK